MLNFFFTFRYKFRILAIVTLVLGSMLFVKWDLPTRASDVFAKKATKRINASKVVTNCFN